MFFRIVLIIAYSTALVCGWGFIGIWTKNFGFKTRWGEYSIVLSALKNWLFTQMHPSTEVWVFQAVWGILVSPWYQVRAPLRSPPAAQLACLAMLTLFPCLFPCRCRST